MSVILLGRRSSGGKIKREYKGFNLVSHSFAINICPIKVKTVLFYCRARSSSVCGPYELHRHSGSGYARETETPLLGNHVWAGDGQVDCHGSSNYSFLTFYK